MSEYQYYEFRAIDRPLTSRETAALRAISSRARITSTSFVNTYNDRDFRGEPDALMETYFDAFLYVANWGTHHLMLRLSKKALAIREWAPFCRGESRRSWCSGEHFILSLRADEIETDWEEEGEGWMDELLPIRGDLLRGDLRALYLGWLRSVQNDEVENEKPEPPVPPGLRTLSEPLDSLARFLDLDRDLLDAAAESSAAQDVARPPKDALSQWISSRPASERDMVLLQAALGEDPHAITGLVRRFERECVRTEPGAPLPLRTAGELRAAADERAKDRECPEREASRLEEERKAKEKAAMRAAYLADLEQRQAAAWDKVDRLAATKRPKDYDTAVTLLADLRELAEHKGSSAAFRERLQHLRARHSGKPSFLRRLNEAGLGQEPQCRDGGQGDFA